MYSYVSYLKTALQTLKLLAKSFSHVITSTMQLSERQTIDFAQEERLEKCRLCVQGFTNIKCTLNALGIHGGPLGSLADEVLEELTFID
jgi:katanin p80 WD40 repeat-containing subunit B1